MRVYAVRKHSLAEVKPDKKPDYSTSSISGIGKDGEDGLRYAGLSQEQKILDWLHDCYFATVAGDAPAFEAWPTHEGEFDGYIIRKSRYRLYD